MNCAAAVVESFSVPLIQPLTVGLETLRVRSGLWIHLKDEAGYVGRGEVAPLPGFSREDLDDAQEQVSELISQLTERSLLEVDTGELLPSVRCGLEMAVQDLTWRQRGTADRWADLSVSLNALVLSDAVNLDETVVALLEDGYSSIKFKVGRQPLTRDIETVHRLRDLVGQRATLRLDANGLWSLDDGCAFARAVGPDSIEYIEDPVSDPSDRQRFSDETGFLLALDEKDPAAYAPYPGVHTWVFKPAILGGLGVCQSLLGRARALGIQVVLSSIFESPHALRFYARWTALQGLTETPQGFDTWRWLEGADRELHVSQGRLFLD